MLGACLQHEVPVSPRTRFSPRPRFSPALHRRRRPTFAIAEATYWSTIGSVPMSGFPRLQARGMSRFQTMRKRPRYIQRTSDQQAHVFGYFLRLSAFVRTHVGRLDSTAFGRLRPTSDLCSPHLVRLGLPRPSWANYGQCGPVLGTISPEFANSGRGWPRSRAQVGQGRALLGRTLCVKSDRSQRWASSPIGPNMCVQTKRIRPQSVRTPPTVGDSWL